MARFPVSAIASPSQFRDNWFVPTLTIHVDDQTARHIEESARREHMSVSDWIKERVKPEAHSAALLAAMELRAVANGYPPEWLKLFASLADDETFVAPSRSSTPEIKSLNGEDRSA